MIKQDILDYESYESNQSIEFQYLTNKIYEELLQSHQLAKKFIIELGDIRTSDLLDSIITYCKDISFNFKSYEVVLELMESRLSKMIKNNKVKKNWSDEDLHILVWLLSKYMEKYQIPSHEQMNQQDWIKISAMIPGSTPNGCMFKFVSLKKFKLAQFKWHKQEENLLYKIIADIGTNNWKTISQRLFQDSTKRKIFRTAKQCRQHWSCYLDPRIKKGPWERQEDRKLLQIVLQSNCQKRWSQIKQQFQGRTENALKNRYNLLLEKQKKITPYESQSQLIMENLKDSVAVKKVIKQSTKSQNIEVPQPIFPVIPEQKRSVNMQYSPGFIFVFSGMDDKMQNVSMNPWFFQI